MSELRNNIVSGEWVIISLERAKRPKDFKKAKVEETVIPDYVKECPFCAGNEANCGSETFRIGDKNSWQVRSVLNAFPALCAKEELSRQSNSIYHSVSGFGFHEVIVEHPKHNMLIPLMTDEEVERIIKTYKQRYVALSAEKEIEAVVLFKNQGLQAGASLKHAHSQVIATPIVPPDLRHRMEKATRYFDNTGKCLLCVMLEEELLFKKRIVLETEHFVSFVPFAAAAPFVTWVFPKKHLSSFTDSSDSELKDLAQHLKTILGKLYRGLDNPDYNYTIRSMPVHEKESEYFHWYLNIVPRITNPAGFELGSGIFINASIPEECAEFLRQVA